MEEAVVFSHLSPNEIIGNMVLYKLMKHIYCRNFTLKNKLFKIILTFKILEKKLYFLANPKNKYS